MPMPLDVLLDPVSLTVLALYAALIGLEALFPARPLPRVRGWRTRALLVFAFCFFLSSYLPMLWTETLSKYQLFNLDSLNPWVGAGLAVLVYEFLVYGWHRFMHRSRWLWLGFHQMHHSAERVDSFGAFYFSPLGIVGWTALGSLTLTIGIGLSTQAASYFLYVTTLLAVFRHTNIRTPQWIGYLIQRPESHCVHHRQGVHSDNFADPPLWDIVFGTFRNPKQYPGAGGFEKEMVMSPSHRSFAVAFLATATVLLNAGARADNAVFPTGRFPDDVFNVRGAVANGGIVLLKAVDVNGTGTAFNFGPAAPGSGFVTLLVDVTLVGETVEGRKTTISGGSIPLRVLTAQSAIRGIHLQGPWAQASRQCQRTIWRCNDSRMQGQLPTRELTTGSRAQTLAHHRGDLAWPSAR